jgi:hypothetical protein
MRAEKQDIYFPTGAESVPTPSLLPASIEGGINISSPLFPPFFSTINPLSHLFSNSSCWMRCSSCCTRSVISLAVFSNCCSFCFFLMRKRAEAAVFRRRLSSSAARRDASSRLVAFSGLETTDAFRLVPRGAGVGAGEAAAMGVTESDAGYGATGAAAIGCWGLGSTLGRV